MFYDARKNDHGLPHDPFKAIVTPRPIGWISSMNKAGQVNLAPFSFFNAVSHKPPIVMFSSEDRKDSHAFIEETGEFVCNLATYDLRNAVVDTSEPLERGINEMEFAGLESAPSRFVKPPRVAMSPCALECKLLEIKQLCNLEGVLIERFMILGQVIGIHIEDRFIRDGLLDTAGMQPLARCGYLDYAVTNETFTMHRRSGKPMKGQRISVSSSKVPG